MENKSVFCYNSSMNIQLLHDTFASYITAHPWIVILVIWSIIWKLIALWKAARNNHMTMFIVLAFVNTAGIAEIIYIVWLHFRNKKKGNLPEQMN